MARSGGLTLFLFVQLAAAQNVLTGNYDNARTNANLSETVLNPNKVSASQFGKLFSLPADGQIHAQPLYMNNVSIPGRGNHNVVFVATEHNSVYAWDADTPGSPLWTVNLGPAVPSSRLTTGWGAAFTDITPEVGILSTPVIDASTGTLYVVAATLEDGIFRYRLHALDVTGGGERFGAPVEITASVPGIGDSSENGAVSFVAGQHLQRPALLLLHGIVYVAFGSHGDAAPWHGWIFGYRARNVQKPTVVFTPTPDGTGGSLWQSGRGLTADSSGGIYVVTGNGDSDQTSNFADNVLKLAAGSLSITDWFAPANVQLLNTTDGDLGASGAVLVPGANLLITGGKEGVLYLLDCGSLGHTSFNNANILQSFQPNNLGIYNLALWNRADGPLVYLANGPFAAYRLIGTQLGTQPVSQSISGTGVPLGGMSISANGGQPGSGILWVTTADQWPLPAPGTLRAYDADDLSIELWNSSMNAAQDAPGAFVKFVNPTVVNGKVYLPGASSLMVYGVTSGTSAIAPVITSVVNAASFAIGPLAPGEMVAIYGQNLGPQAATAGSFDAKGSTPTSVSGTQVTFNGVTAPVLYSSAGTVSAIVPFEVAGADHVDVQVSSWGIASNTRTLPLAPGAPGIFSTDGSGRGPGFVLNEDYNPNSDGNPAAAGSTVILYATGGGLTNPQGVTGSTAAGAEPLVAPVSATVAGIPAEVPYAGSAPDQIEGIVQINIEVPGELVGRGPVPVVVSIGGQTSQANVTVEVK